MNDIRVQVLDLDPATKGVVILCPDDNYLVIINSVYNTEQQREAFNHEVRHLLSGHYQQGDRAIEELEAEASAKGALLEKIKDAALNGLPLETALNKEEKAPPVKVEPEVCKTKNIEDEKRKMLHREKRAALTGAWY